MREKIAIAISGAPFPSKRSLDKADAVLEALMEPDLSMQNAGWKEAGSQGLPIEDVEVDQIFVAMIQAARDEK